MSGLALAGAISGAGQGMQQGLVNMQQGFIQSGLLKERDEMENKRMQLTFAHQEKLQAEKIASDRAIHADTLQNAKDINQTNAGVQLTTAGMNKDVHEKIAKEANDLNLTIAKMKDNREALNTGASLDISKNSAYVKIIDTAEKSIDRIRVDQVVLEKAAATAAPGDPIFDRIKELDRQMGIAQKEVDLYKGALGSRLGAPVVPTTPKFKLPSELTRTMSKAPETPAEAPIAGDASQPLADFQLRRPLTPKTGLVDAVTGTYTPFLGSIANAIRRASEKGKDEASK